MNLAAAPQNKTMSSREIAELTGKQHNNVVRDIINMFKGLELRPEGYAQNWVHPQNNQTYVEYMLDQDLTTCLLTGYDVKARMAVIKRWKALETKASQIPQTLPEALRMAADLAEHNTKLLEKAKEDAPKVQFVNDFVEHGDSKCFREVAAILGVKQGFLMDTLRIKKIVYKAGGDWKAYSDYDKHFETKVGVNNWTDKITGEPMSKDYTQLRVTTGGLVWLKKRLGVNAPALKAVK